MKFIRELIFICKLVGFLYISNIPHILKVNTHIIIVIIMIIVNRKLKLYHQLKRTSFRINKIYNAIDIVQHIVYMF